MCTICVPLGERDRLHGEVRQRAVADRSEVVFARFALQKRDKFRGAVNHNAGIDRERARLRHQLGDRRDVGLGVVGQLREQQRVDGERPADADPDGGAVGRGLGHRVGADVAARARLVVDDERLTELFLQMVGDQAGDHVGRRARAERHDDLHGLGRPVLRGRGQGREQAIRTGRATIFMLFLI